MLLLKRIVFCQFPMSSAVLRRLLQIFRNRNAFEPMNQTEFTDSLSLMSVELSCLYVF